MEYKMTDVTVSSMRPKGATQGKEAVPLEEVTFSYHKIEWAYTVIDYMTGMPKGEVKAYWDLVTDSGG
jgi:type VI protein secretion system component Hcp